MADAALSRRASGPAPLDRVGQAAGERRDGAAARVRRRASWPTPFGASRGPWGC